MEIMSTVYNFVNQFRAAITAIGALAAGIFLSGVYFADARQNYNESMRALEDRLVAAENTQRTTQASIEGDATNNLDRVASDIENKVSNIGRTSVCESVAVIVDSVAGKPRCPAGWFVRGIDQAFADGSWRTHLTHIECCPLTSN